MDRLANTVIPFPAGSHHGLRWLALSLGNGARLAEDALSGVARDSNEISDHGESLGGLAADLDALVQRMASLEHRIGVVADLAARMALAK
ncbi:hypothetical protein A6A04_17390 [Paramagnetospirillum marisnigri]|uniref:Uncharacterized protein n=1 Tax=Paramagnetospirillum marisnigri TaxID=1285242 RepID=A0A178MRP7_9PROT|nr:hypothetical protein [Paramagnetospirillum marisnigri]OAN50727.1 hypothetical protein A6A04_17390 [Paramagnetospirillum marisnigri]